MRRKMLERLGFMRINSGSEFSGNVPLRSWGQFRRLYKNFLSSKMKQNCKNIFYFWYYSWAIDVYESSKVAKADV